MTMTAEAAAAPMTAPFLVVDNFLPLEMAQTMRRYIEAHFAGPNAHKPQTHQIWNYWHVPGMYTYLRTTPDRLMPAKAVEALVEALRKFSIGALGMGEVSRPYLSMYVNGCRQGVHNDSRNGRFAFVYSLTKNQRLTTGGETIVFKEGDLFRDHVGTANAGHGFFDAIEPKFNRLVIFDDRMPHAVERVDGSMDPLEARFVFHGHIKESGPIVAGALKPAQVNPVVLSALAPFCDDAFARIRLYHGPLALRLVVAPDGKVQSCRVVMDRVTAPAHGDSDWEGMRDRLVAAMTALRFPEAQGPTTITQPVMFGASLFR